MNLSSLIVPILRATLNEEKLKIQMTNFQIILLSKMFFFKMVELVLTSRQKRRTYFPPFLTKNEDKLLIIKNIH